MANEPQINRIIAKQMETFCQSYGVPDDTPLPTKFEHFANYLTFLNVCPTAYDCDRNAYKKVHTGKGGDDAIDGILITIEDTPVFTLEAAKDFINSRRNKPFNVEFIFTQAKTSTKFESGEMLKTGRGVKDFFSPNYTATGKIRKFQEIAEYIFDKCNLFKENPTCTIFYVTTGNWTEDPHLVRLKNDTENDLKRLNLFSDVKFSPIDGAKVQTYYKLLTYSITKTLPIERYLNFPEIPGIIESYIGYVKGSDFIELITLEDGKLNKSIFYENVRAFLGENNVNKNIAETLENTENCRRFVILNNGITIVARETSHTGDKFTLRDYQIVNGCQTSHVLFDHRDKLANVMIPVKLIASDNQKVINMIIQSTNNQTQVDTDAFESIKDIHKHIQNYYDSFSLPDRLYYERRKREYDKINNAKPRAQVFTIPQQLMCHAAMFLDQPHLAERLYYGNLLRRNSDCVFQKDDNPIVYYTSARTQYKVEKWLSRAAKNVGFKNVKRFIYPILSLIRHHYQGVGKTTPRLNSKAIVKFCDDILADIEDETKMTKLMNDIINELFTYAKNASDSKGNINIERLAAEIANAYK